MRNSLLISLWMLLSTTCTSVRDVPKMSIERPFDTENTSRYRVLVKAEQMDITGIMVVKYTDNEWRGSLINEFGIKAFDFVVADGKCRLQQTMPLINKWYIRKTIESDFAFLFGEDATAKGKHLDFLDEVFILKNVKRNIEYSFQPMSDG